MDSNTHAATAGTGGYPGEPTTATHATVYATAYSDIPVFEAMVRNVAVMMRRSDMWLNATQILKVAGVNKTARTKYLDREISKGTHQKIQGGYGKYQGTWVPYQTGVDLARSFGVLGLLEPVFSLQAHAAQLPLSTPSLPVPSPAAYSAGTNNTTNLNPGAPISPAPAPGQGRSLAGGMNMILGSQPSAVAASGPSTGGPVPGLLTADPQSRRTPGGSGSFDVGTSSMARHYAPGAGPMAPGGPHHPAYDPSHRGDGMLYSNHVQMGQSGQPSIAPGGYYAPNASVQQQAGGAGYVPQRGGLKRPLGTGDEGFENASTPGLYVDQYGRSYMVEGDAGQQPPLKRSKQDQPGGFGFSEGDGMTMDVLTDGSVPPGMRLANRPDRPGHSDVEPDSPSMDSGAHATSSSSRARTKLLAIFEAKETTEVDLDALLALSPRKPTAGADGEETGDLLVVDDENEDDENEDDEGKNGETLIDIDQVIDDRGHTALHWAAALARDSIIAQLIQRGADVHRGNFAGETPLIRAILTTNNADRNNLSTLLDHYLGSSIKTIDNAHRSVLHHVALVAGIKGRATSANYYMSTLLEWIAGNEEEGLLKALVNLRDMQGDTALNVAARVGNKNLVKLLLDAGADASRANKIGLRPVDYGLEVPGLEAANGYGAIPAADVFSQVPYTKGSDLLKRLSNMIQQLNNDFRQEIGSKQSNLDQIHAQVVLVTRELAEERRKITAAQNLVKEVEAVQQQSHDLEKVLPLEAAFEWYPGQMDSLAHDAVVDPIVDRSSGSTLVQLRRIRTWQRRTEGLLDQKLLDVAATSAEKTAKYRKVIATCVKLPVDKVDEKLLDELTKAMDSDGALLDSGKMTAFIQRVNG